MPYNIGDKPWYAGNENTQKTMTCPECLGKKYLTVILGDGTQVTIDCAGCSLGYDPPRGYVTYHEYGPSVHQATICKVEISSEGVKYGIDGNSHSYHIAEPINLFDTKEEAEVRAQELADEHNQEEHVKINQKDYGNRHRTWSWHVHYYRQQIRRAKDEIEYAEAKLDAAKSHTKKINDEL